MKKRTLLALSIALLAAAVSATPAWSQCWVCSCCEAECENLGSDQGGGTNDIGFFKNDCPDGCGVACPWTEEEDAELALLDLEAVWAKLRSLDPVRIREALEANPTRVMLNEGRSAIQILGCNDTYLAHLSLPEDVAAALIPENET